MLKRTAIFVHRWLGVVLCLFFLLWFPSGFVMMYWDYPSIRPADRLAHLAPIDPGTIRLPPGEPAAKADVEPSTAVRLTTFAGRPVYRFGGRGGSAVVYADTGEEHHVLTQNDAARVAQMWTGTSSKDASAAPVERSDIWTLQNRVGDLQPLWKFCGPTSHQRNLSE